MADEKRIVRIETKLDREIKESATFRGEHRQFMAALPTTIASAVHSAVEAHNSDMNAHGAGVKRDLDKKVVGWVTAGAAVLGIFSGAIGAGLHKFWEKVGP